MYMYLYGFATRFLTLLHYYFVYPMQLSPFHHPFSIFWSMYPFYVLLHEHWYANWLSRCGQAGKTSQLLPRTSELRQYQLDISSESFSISVIPWLFSNPLIDFWFLGASRVITLVTLIAHCLFSDFNWSAVMKNGHQILKGGPQTVKIQGNV